MASDSVLLAEFRPIDGVHTTDECQIQTVVGELFWIALVLT